MSSSSNRRRFVVKHPVVVDIGCGCRRSKLFSFFSSFSRPKPKPGKLIHSLSPSSTATSLWETTATSAYDDTSSTSIESMKFEKKNRRKKKEGKVVEESMPVVKESTEPYVDFRESMVQMIVEKELYAWDDLNDLLHRFLSLNSPCHHHHILRAFADIWDGVCSRQW